MNRFADWIQNKSRLLFMCLIFVWCISNTVSLKVDLGEKPVFPFELKMAQLEKLIPHEDAEEYNLWFLKQAIKNKLLNHLLKLQQRINEEDDRGREKALFLKRASQTDYKSNSNYNYVYPNAMRMFQIGHVSRIINRRRQQIRRQQMRDQAKSRESKSSVTAPTSVKSIPHYSSQLQALAFTDNEPPSPKSQILQSQLSDSKVTGSDSKVGNKNQKPETTNANLGNYAFTSNHWGPLGKRSLGFSTILHHV